MARFTGDFLQKVRDNTNILDAVGVLCIVKEEKGKTIQMGVLPVSPGKDSIFFCLSGRWIILLLRLSCRR